MHLLMYSSDYTGKHEDISQDLEKILEIARINNPTIDVTGVLFFDKNKFIQVLEGEEANLRGLVEKIKKSPLHENFTVLMDVPIPRREFKDWNMKAFHLTKSSDINWDKLEDFRDVYEENFKPSSKQIVRLLQHFIEHNEQFNAI